MSKFPGEMTDEEIEGQASLSKRPLGRLSDMKTREISVVDFAANKRRFLLIKRNSSMAGTALEQISSYAKVIGSARDRVAQIKAAFPDTEIELANTEKARALPHEVCAEVRSVQALLKCMAGVSSVMIQGDEPEAGSVETTKAVREDVLAILAEVDKRLEDLEGDVGDSAILDSNQTRKMSAVADILGTIVRQYPSETMKASGVASTSVAPGVRKELKASIEKTVFELGDLLVALDTEPGPDREVAKVEKVAELLGSSMANVEGVVIKLDIAGEDKGGARLIDEAVAELRAMQAKVQDPGSLGGQVPPELAAALRRVMVILGAVMQRYPSVGGVKSSSAKAKETEAIMEALMKCGILDIDKVGRPMKATRLARLKSAITLLKAALADLRSGSVSMEKFRQVGDVLTQIIHELQVEKAANTGRGITDPRGLTPDAPNGGSGIQIDTDAVADVTAIQGEGMPKMDAILKRLDGLEATRVETEKASSEQAEKIKTQDAELAKLRSENATLKKRRSAPAAPPEDGETKKTKAEVQKSAYEAPGWPADMNEMPSLQGAGH